MAHPLDAAIGMLVCPVCGERLDRLGQTLRCPRRHSYDIARQGHVNLLGHSAPRNADTAVMVAARERFLSAGYYSPIRDAVAAACPAGGRVVEVGAGTGYYVSAVAAAGRLALDVSAAAARRAAGHGLAAAVADTWAGLPVGDGCVDALLCVFAPRNPTEFARVLRPGGQAVVVTPQPDHLAALRRQLGLLDIGQDKQERLDESFAAAGLALVARTGLRFSRVLPARAVADLVAMGPNAFHGHAPIVDAVGEASTPIEVAVDVSTFVASPS